jgi:hypothetical protein
MVIQNISPYLLIYVGAGIIFLSTLKMRKILGLNQGNQYLGLWRLLLVLIVVFLMGGSLSDLGEFFSKLATEEEFIPLLGFICLPDCLVIPPDYWRTPENKYLKSLS